MQIVGTIMEVGINVQCPKNGGGTYPGTRITYRDNEGSLKEQMLHANATKYNPELKDAIASLKKDDVFTMTKEKEGQHWNVKSIVKGTIQGTPSVTADNPRTTGSTQASNTSPKSTYQTAEERAQTQVYIVRQSTITQAINYFQYLKGTAAEDDQPATYEEVIELAKKFEAHVFGNKIDSGSIADLESDVL